VYETLTYQCFEAYFGRFFSVFLMEIEKKARKFAMLEFSISASLSRLFFPVSTDVEFDSCGKCVVTLHSRSVHLSVNFGVYFAKEKKLN
jgi:hypothetical protein